MSTSDVWRMAIGLAVVVAVLSPQGAAAAGAQADLFVAPDGNDDWSGRRAEASADRTDGPLATVTRARDLLRQRKRSDPDRQRPWTVRLRGGTYFLDQPLILGPDDSGREDAPVVFAAYRDERPVLSAGQPIDRWQVGADGYWCATLPRVRAGTWTFAQLFVNDQRRFRPRLPATGF